MPTSGKITANSNDLREFYSHSLLHSLLAHTHRERRTHTHAHRWFFIVKRLSNMISFTCALRAFTSCQCCDLVGAVAAICHDYCYCYLSRSGSLQHTSVRYYSAKLLIIHVHLLRCGYSNIIIYSVIFSHFSYLSVFVVVSYSLSLTLSHASIFRMAWKCT